LLTSYFNVHNLQIFSIVLPKIQLWMEKYHPYLDECNGWKYWRFTFQVIILVMNTMKMLIKVEGPLVLAHHSWLRAHLIASPICIKKFNHPYFCIICCQFFSVWFYVCPIHYVCIIIVEAIYKTLLHYYFFHACCM